MEKITFKKVALVLLWVFSTTVVMDWSMALINKPDDLLLCFGVLIMFCWGYITYLTKFFTKKIKFKK